MGGHSITRESLVTSGQRAARQAGIMGPWGSLVSETLYSPWQIPPGVVCPS